MLTRLKVSGFKNLVDVDVRFGPFTCIAGANGVGKSNLFDAIGLLSALASHSLVEAALSVRDDGGRTTDIRSLFHCVGDYRAPTMSFEAEMIVPLEGEDDLGQIARATSTFLRYKLELGYRTDESRLAAGSLEIVREELTHITLGDAAKNLLFRPSAGWRMTAVSGRRFAPYFMSTEGQGAARVIKLHQDTRGDEKGRGRPLSLLAANLPRTVLSTANAAENPTALMARREMQSWRLLQLEPSALRSPDSFSAESRLGANGSHLAAALHRLAQSDRTNGHDKVSAEARRSHVFGQVANRLADLIDDVDEVSVDTDERRELLTVQVTGRDGTIHPARALSDGTLRFLALSVLALDPEAKGVLCLEEPENGIHPRRIPAMLKLLQDIATDATEEIGPDNPLRQVIINTHSPAVVAQIPDDSLLIARLTEMREGGRLFNGVSFGCLPDTWRARPGEQTDIVSKGKLLDYLNPVGPLESPSNGHQQPVAAGHAARKTRRVIDRADVQELLPLWDLER
jgi:predicted ATPase